MGTGWLHNLFFKFKICLFSSSIWYLRKSSYQSHFYRALSSHFPDSGERVMVYVGRIRYWDHLAEMGKIQAVLDDSDYIRYGHFNLFYRVIIWDGKNLPLT